MDENPSGITHHELQSWVKEGHIQYLGEVESVQSILEVLQILCIAIISGTPRSSLEALSTGRPIITTDVPGCRETVVHKKNGLLVLPKNSELLAEAMISLLEKKMKKFKQWVNKVIY